MQPIFEQATSTIKSTTQASWVAFRHALASVEKLTTLHLETTKSLIDETKPHETASSHPMLMGLHLNQIAIDKLTHYSAHACSVVHDAQTCYQEVLRLHLNTLSHQWQALAACVVSPAQWATQTAPAVSDAAKAAPTTNKRTA